MESLLCLTALDNLLLLLVVLLLVVLLLALALQLLAASCTIRAKTCPGSKC
jgi:hypothetical protein